MFKHVIDDYGLVFIALKAILKKKMQAIGV